MNKSALKTFAINARKALIETITYRAQELGITDKEIVTPEQESSDSIVIRGRVFDSRVKEQRKRLLHMIERSTLSQVIDEVAYTWFNRFVAIRFMEIHHYLDHELAIISSLNPSAMALKATQHFSLNRDEIAPLVFENKDEEIFKRLIIAQCNSLSVSMPFLFESINDYTELLFPAGLLHKDSVIRTMVETIPEEDWQDVEIIGWLYQFYISEKKEEIVGMDKGTIEKPDIPAATQLFTYEWIVRYMVQNSLGRLWYEMYPDSDLIREWEFFLKPEPEDMTSRTKVKLEEITFLDPCCGSGHILVYAFDLFFRMYQELGYLDSEIPELIIRHNLRGLDICERAVQLATFSLLMKTRAHTPDMKKITPVIYALTEAESLTEDARDEALRLLCRSEAEKKELQSVLESFSNARNFGSLIFPPVLDYDNYISRFNEFDKQYSIATLELKTTLLPLLLQAKILSHKHDVVATNPPYLNKYNADLKKFVEKHYRDYKSDLFSAFIFKCNEMTKPEGYCAMMSPMTWMFIKTHEKLREYVIGNRTITSLVQPEYHSFFSSAFVPIMMLVTENVVADKKGIFIDLNQFYGEEVQAEKLKEAVEDPGVGYRYRSSTKGFKAIPGAPIAYWASERVRGIFEKLEKIGNVSEIKVGLQTSDNDRFLRFWFEVSFNNIGFNYESREKSQKCDLRWFPLNKGGPFRKWYGNNEYVVNWKNDGYEIRNFFNEKGKLLSRPQNLDFYFKPGVTWSFISSSNLGVRYQSKGFIFDHAGPCLFIEEKQLKYTTAYLCSIVPFDFIKLLNTTMNFEVGNIASLPIIFPSDPAVKARIDALAEECIAISRLDWDSFETSWDFQVHPFITHRPTWDGGQKVQAAFNAWKAFTDSQFSRLKANEEELNRIFIDIYDLADEMTPDVEDKDITIRKADLPRDVRSFLAYAVGCMMGRYSLDEPGLVYAGGTFDPSKYQSFNVDDDAILPVLGDTWFDDDIVTRFIAFVRTVFGGKHHHENLLFIAEALGKTERETPEERIRKYFMSDFYKDHLKIYQKRPIYWLFTSGKEKAFNALVYLHRYNKDTLARLRKDYLHELQAKLDREVKFLEERNEKKKLSLLTKQQEELRRYDELLKHFADQRIELDLDDGVAVNYKKFGKLVMEIK
ncbi:MAG: BREX-1 system adenine-specific DNA-methyltransferase PglX [Vulcanimicrobiota bacterium]